MKKYYFLAMFMIAFMCSSPAYAWFNSSMDYRMLDNQNYSIGTTLANFPYLVNTSGFNLGGTYTQWVWSKASTVNGSNYLYFDSNTAYQMVNGSDNTAHPFEVEAGNSTSYLNQSLWGSEYIGVWHLGESGTTLYDSTANGNNGSKAGTIAYNTSGKFFGAYSFKGAATDDNYISVAAATTLKVTGSVSWEAWLWVNNITHVNGWLALSKGNKNYAIGAWGSGSANNGKLFCRTSDGVTWDITATASMVATKNVWIHVGCVWTNAAGMKIYINGTEAGTAAAGGRSIPQTDTILYIGSGQGEQDMNGTMDEVRIMNVDKPASYFAASFKSGQPGFSTLGPTENNVPATCYTTGSGFISIPVGCALVLAIGSLVV